MQFVEGGGLFCLQGKTKHWVPDLLMKYLVVNRESGPAEQKECGYICSQFVHPSEKVSILVLIPKKEGLCYPARPEPKEKTAE
jgi:hypothetical protein